MTGFQHRAATKRAPYLAPESQKFLYAHETLHLLEDVRHSSYAGVMPASYSLMLSVLLCRG